MLVFTLLKEESCILKWPFDESLGDPAPPATECRVIVIIIIIITTAVWQMAAK